MTGVLIRIGDYNTDTHRRPCDKDTARRWPFISQRERPSEDTNLADTLVLESSLQNFEEIQFCCLRHWSVVLYYGSPSKLIHPMPIDITYGHPHSKL